MLLYKSSYKKKTVQTFCFRVLFYNEGMPMGKIFDISEQKRRGWDCSCWIMASGCGQLNDTWYYLPTKYYNYTRFFHKNYITQTWTVWFSEIIADNPEILWTDSYWYTDKRGFWSGWKRHKIFVEKEGEPHCVFYDFFF